MSPAPTRSGRPRSWLTPVEHIFLDFDGVINDDEEMNRESRQFIAQRMASEHGGVLEKWLEALQQASAAANQWARNSPLRESDIARWLKEYDRVWLEQLFLAGGLTLPSEGQAELGWRLREEAYRNVNTLYPEVPQALALLRADAGAGSSERSLYVASGGRRVRLEVMLTRAGIREFFHELFGCDTVNIVKESAEYYRRIFQRLALPPSVCLVVDNNPDCVRWAQAAGASAALLDRKGQAPAGAAPLVVSNLIELAQALLPP